MGKNIYIGASNIARKAQKIYVGVDGVARKAKRVYVGVDGVAKLAWASEFEFSYSGNYQFSGNPGGDWELKILSSGLLTLLSLPTPIDIFMVGAGGAGSKLAGGGGGECVAFYNQTIKENDYAMNIGVPGTPQGPAYSGSTTRCFGDAYLARGGYGAKFTNPDGNKGGTKYAKGGDYYAYGWEGSSSVCKGEDSTAKAFGEGNTYYGGGGSATYGSYDQWGGDVFEGFSGGRGGGGRSFSSKIYPSASYTAGTAGEPNTGGGGGADDKNGGMPGGSGIIIIRNHRG